MATRDDNWSGSRRLRQALAAPTHAAAEKEADERTCGTLCARHRVIHDTLVLVVSLAVSGTACSAGPASPDITSPGTESLPADTYRLDLRYFERGRSALFTNESLAFRPDLGVQTTRVTGEGDAFRKVYNRLPCQVPRGSSDDDDLATQGFHGTDQMASERPVRLETISLEMPDNDDAQSGVPDRPVRQICFAYHTSDGRWHGRFAPVATTHDDLARLSRVTLQVDASGVDVVGVVVYDGFVSLLSFVATPE